MTNPGDAAAIYVRRSGSAAGTNQTLQEQESEARALAAREGLAVVEVYREREGTGASARSGKHRPQWEAALVALDAGDRFRTVVVWALDRADRRGSDTLGTMLTRHAATGRRILGVDGTDTSDPQQRLATIIRGEIAREYSEKLGDNIARTKRYRREAGLWLGGPTPWGLRVGSDGKLEHDPVAYPEARHVAELLLSGETLYAAVADLNARQVTLPGGKPWGSVVTRKVRGLDLDKESAPQKWRIPTLATLVRSPGWAGLQSIRHRELREDGSKGAWPLKADVYRSTVTGEPVSVGHGVVSPEEQAVIVARIEERKHAGVFRATGRKPRRTLLGSRLRCTECGALAVRNGAAPRTYYRCGNATQGGGRCKGFSAPADDMDDYVTGRALIFLSSLDPQSEATREAIAAWVGETDDAAKAERRAGETTVAAAKADLARVRRLVVMGVLNDDEAAAEMPRLRDALARAESLLADRQAAATVMSAAALQDLQYIAEAWDDLDQAAQRRIIEATVRTVDVYRAPYRGARFVGGQRAVITFADGSMWPRDGKTFPHPGRAPDTIRKAAGRARRAADVG